MLMVGCRYDLTRLMSSQRNYQASKDGFMFEVNICRPLVPVPGNDAQWVCVLGLARLHGTCFWCTQVPRAPLVPPPASFFLKMTETI
jgi:hypothetical protein